LESVGVGILAGCDQFLGGSALGSGAISPPVSPPSHFATDKLAASGQSAPEVGCVDGLALQLQVVEKLAFVAVEVLDHLQQVAAQR
jgi:hypothetical protein